MNEIKFKTNVSVHTMTDVDIEGIEDVETSVLSINSMSAYLLFDCGVICEASTTFHIGSGKGMEWVQELGSSGYILTWVNHFGLVNFGPKVS